MNIISLSRPVTQEDRTARQLRMCEEMAELGMNLARKAAQDAAARQSADPAAGDRRSTLGKTTDPATLFTRLCSAIRQAIALEARLAAGQKPNRKVTGPALPADSRRATLRQVFFHVTERNPNRVEIRRATSARLDEELAEDPDGKIHIGDLFTKICEDLAVEIDLATLPDALLDLLCPEDADQQAQHQATQPLPQTGIFRPGP